MARVSVLEKHRLTPQLAKYAERASVSGPALSVKPRHEADGAPRRS